MRTAPRMPSGGLRGCAPGPRRRDPSPYLDTDTALDPRHVLDELDGLLPGDDRRLVIGGGRSAPVACCTLGASSPADWSCTSTDFGAIGQGLGVAIRCLFARPGQRVVYVTGDGDFMMGIAELDTAIRYSLPLTILVLNDQAMARNVTTCRAAGFRRSRRLRLTRPRGTGRCVRRHRCLPDHECRGASGRYRRRSATRRRG